MIRTATKKWLKALAAAIITGSSNAFLSAIGIPAVNAVLKVNIPNLTGQQLGLQILIGGGVGMCAYLKQSPVPPDSNGDSAPPFPLADGSNTKPKE